ncbi:hypothetical protein GU926_14030 [Nibribacter ruber]|uniref:Uncharacterized protein n=1 Tax=Nibribacter ruber TaxID=2698458 RepID=A0A6P1P266_9BACT|nr:hypothetical protein [Nibribacter ruber]QHL88488.1 hypothetical protein GU926_14030 [Nibribacter ruber]
MENTPETNNTSSTSPGKRLRASAARPQLPEQDALAPDQVHVWVRVVDVLPVLDKTDTGPCGQSPCSAEVLVEKVLAYGAAFTANLAQGQQVRVHFPMTLEAVAGRPAIKVGDRLDALLSQTAAPEGTNYRMHGFALLP